MKEQYVVRCGSSIRIKIRRNFVKGGESQVYARKLLHQSFEQCSMFRYSHANSKEIVKFTQFWMREMK